MNILIINGPNLNMLGKREPSIYGTWSLEDLEKDLIKAFPGCTLYFFQSNSESEIIDRIHTCVDEDVDGLIINAGAFTHTSLAIADALRVLSLPVIEVHISNIWNRESYRSISYISPVTAGQISGLGKHSYFLAVHALLYSRS